MILYIGILFTAFIIAIRDTNNRKINISIGNKRLLNKSIMLSALLLYMFLFVLTAFRDRTIGNDTDDYIRIFNSTVNSGTVELLSSRIEIGFRLYCCLIGQFTSNPQALLIISATICYLLTGIFIFYMSDYQGIMIALFIPLMFKNYCSGMRQALAFSFCLIAYMMIKQGKYYIGGIIILLATSFHITALSALFYYIIPLVMKNKKFKYALIGLLIIGGIVLRYSGMLAFFNKYGSYYEGYYSEYGRAKIGYLSCALTMFVALFVFSTYVYIKKKTNNSNIEWNDDETIWFGFAILMIGIINFFSNNASRLMWYFELPFLVNLINRTSKMIIKERQKVIIPIVALYQSVFVVSMILRPYYYSLVPYHFWGM